jgi:RNA polymerase sigma factor (sigma-70 family)
MKQNLEERQAFTLFSQAQAGDKDAFGTLLESFRSRLRVEIDLRLGPRLRTRVATDDVIQETFLKAIQLRDRFHWKGSASFFHWLGRIARHAIGNLARRNRDLRRQVRLPGRGSDERSGASRLENWWGNGGSSAGSARRIQRDERLERLTRALKALPPDRRGRSRSA